MSASLFLISTWPSAAADGVSPGYGAQADPGNGFQDTLTCELQGSLEWSNLPYARGILDNYLRE